MNTDDAAQPAEHQTGIAVTGYLVGRNGVRYFRQVVWCSCGWRSKTVRQVSHAFGLRIQHEQTHGTTPTD